MSRCGSCDLYSPDENDTEVRNFGIVCTGDCGVEECADNLQSLVCELRLKLSEFESEKKGERS